MLRSLKFSSDFVFWRKYDVCVCLRCLCSKRKRASENGKNKREIYHALDSMMSFRYCCYNNNNNHYGLVWVHKIKTKSSKISLSFSLFIYFCCLVSNKRLSGWNEHDDCHNLRTVPIADSHTVAEARRDTTSLVWRLTFGPFAQPKSACTSLMYGRALLPSARAPFGFPNIFAEIQQRIFYMLQILTWLKRDRQTDLNFIFTEKFFFSPFVSKKNEMLLKNVAKIENWRKICKKNDS